MKVNWKLQLMKFKVNGENVTLQGDPSLCCASISLKLLWKALEQQGQ